MLRSSILLGSVLLILPGAAVSSAVQPKNSFNISVQGDRLAFATIADYRRAVDEPSAETKAALARALGSLTGFTSLAQKQKAAKTEAIRDEYFAAILNPDMVVQIGDHIFRVDPAAERVHALPVKYADEYRDLLTGNARNPHIRSFSTGDDVLDRIESAGGVPKTFCSQSGIGGKSDSKLLGAMTVSADFVRYGLYFTLFAKSSPYGSSAYPYVMDFTGGISANKGAVYYRVRCGNTVNYVTTTSGSWHAIHQKFQSYQGSKNLNQVYFVYRLKLNGVYQTSNVGFRVNK